MSNLAFHYGDALEVLRGIEEPIGLASTITSPPYWGKLDYGVGDEQVGLEDNLLEYVYYLRCVFQEVLYHSLPGAALMVNIGDTWNNYSSVRSRIGETKGDDPGNHRRRLQAGYAEKERLGIPERLLEVIRGVGWIHRDTFIWVKGKQSRPSKSDRPSNDWEPILYFRKPSGSKRYKQHYWHPAVLPSNVLTYTPASHPKHPCPMPWQMAKDLVAATCEPNGKVLDPFMGLGTVPMAAEALGRYGIGVDLKKWQ